MRQKFAMKQFLHIAILWFVVLSTNYSNCKRLRKRSLRNSSRSVKGFHPRYRRDLTYPYHTKLKKQLLTDKAVKYGQQSILEAYSHSTGRLKRGSNNISGNKASNGKASHASLLPQPAKPLRVVATSAVIKNRLKKTKPLKAIHIWGPTPFKTVMENLRKLNVNLQKQRGAVKRLFLPVQLQRKQLLNALTGRSPFPGPTGPFIRQFPPFNPEREFPTVSPPIHSPNAIHLEEGPPPASLVPGPIGLGPPPLPFPPQPVSHLHEMEPVHLREETPDHAFLHPPDFAPVPEITPMHESAPLPPFPTTIGPPPDEFPANFDPPDIPANLPANFEPPPGLFEPPLPFQMAGEIRQHVNRHVHKGVSKAKCSPNPCKNDGVCTAFEKHYECECPMGFMGKDCEEVNHCLPNPCKNGGNCYATTSGYHCTCVKGFKGPNCDITSKCIPSPCKNGGTCEENGGSYKCLCLPGFEGSNCEAADHCAIGNPCKNGGTCLNGEKNFECHCLPGFYGSDCGDLDMCYTNPCQNSGTCHNTGAGQFMCLCPVLFRGITCDEKFSKCESQPCQNEGTCEEDEEEGFHCVCSSKYQGRHCEVPTELHSACFNNPCVNGGKCVPVENTYKCICKSGFSGNTCEGSVKMTAVPVLCADCHAHARCLDGKCVCEEGYGGNGNVCEVLKVTEISEHTPTAPPTSLHVITGSPLSNVCHPNPCYNGGSCHETAKGFTCDCAEHYMGPLCKHVSPCLGNPCENGGTCIEGGVVGGYICRCREGYNGENCEEASACEPNPCKNGGTCHLKAKSYVCQCTQRFEGFTCAEDKCARCDVHAHCENGKCVCDGGYYGAGTLGECFRVGASNPRFCVPNPCQHGGSCFEEANGHRCVCTSDYDGENCELSTRAAPPSHKIPDPCAGEPCKNGGSCVPKANKFQCLCSMGFEGPTCEVTAKSYCHPNPCLHGGKCTDSKSGYTCKCIGSYRGVNCEVDDCEQCDIHAICVQGACKCRVGFKGDGFECKKVKRCHHCSPNATCINNECVCKTGFIGNGQQCHKDDCQGCPLHSHCKRGICICIPGFVFDGHHCVATLPKPEPASCPAECSKGLTCPETCPSKCCKTSEQQPVCPDHCYHICGPACPDHCCPQTLDHPLSPSPLVCPPECHISCHQSCPVHCCKIVTLASTACPSQCQTSCAPSCSSHCCTPQQACPPECHISCSQVCPGHCCKVVKPVAAACPSQCQTSCAPSCPSNCCTPQYQPTVAPAQLACHSICKTTCLPACPKHCCVIRIFPVSFCPDRCQETCDRFCPSFCCSLPRLSTQQPTSAPQICPSTCSASCLPPCPKFCCKISITPLNNCPSTCIDNCLPSCPKHCCEVPYLPNNLPSPSPDACPSHCTYHCDSSCPLKCCLGATDHPLYPPQPSAQTPSSNGSDIQGSFLSVSPPLSKCPAYCLSSCIPVCPIYCCQRQNISPLLVKSPEETVPPLGRSLKNIDADYKAKMVHHLSELLASPLLQCQPSCFSECSDACPKMCCDIRKKKKMYVFRRKKKAHISKPFTGKNGDNRIENRPKGKE